MTLASFRPRAGLRAALCFLLFVSISRSQIGADPIPAHKPPNFPDWWFSRAVIPRKSPPAATPSWPDDYRESDDYAALNQGQLKAIASAAYDELAAHLPGGAGAAVTALIKSWYQLDASGNFVVNSTTGARLPRTANVHNFQPVNAGQLKTVAQPFYDRFITAGLCPGSPWSYSAGLADDYALVNLGQAKSLFQFVLGSSVPVNEYGLSAWFEAALGPSDAVDRARGTYPGGPRDPNSDDDGDGLSNAEEYAAGTRSSGFGSTDSDGDGVPDGLDGWPMNADLNPPRVAQTRFAVLPLGPNAIPADAQLWNTLGDGCQILYVTSAGLYYLWSPGGTKQVLLDGMGLSPLSPDGTKVAGAVGRTVDATQGAVWDAVTGTTRLGQVNLNPPAHDSEYWTEYATCVNNLGTAAGRTFQEFKGPVYTLYDSGALWEGSIGERLGRDGGNFNVGKATFHPTTINNNNVSVGQSLNADMLYGTGVIVPGGVFKRLTSSQAGVVPTLNNLANPWVIDGEGHLRVNIGGIWKDEPIATWGALAPTQIAEGSIWGLNDRCELIGGFYNGPNGKTGNLVRNGQVFNVNDLIDGYTVATAGLLAINNSGVILTYVTPNGTQTAVPALLMPVEMMVDGNRDGKMSFTDAAIQDADRTTASRPFRFWVNNDSDGSAEGEESQSGAEDASDNIIKSLRDLEDFTRLWINFDGLVSLVKSGAGVVSARLEWKPNSGDIWSDAAGIPSINIFRASEQDGGTKYLTDRAAAINQTLFGGVPNDYCISIGRVSRNAPTFTLPADLVGGLTEAHPNIFLLFEGQDEGKGRLVLTLYQGVEKLATFPPVFMDIKNIKRMYQRGRVASRGLQSPYSVNPLPNVTARFEPYDLGRAFEQPFDETKEVAIFIHGSNESEVESLLRAETLFKRLWQQGYKGRLAFFRWDTLVGPNDGEYPIGIYNENEWRAWNYGAALKSFTGSLPKDYRRNFLAHSMGNIVASEALKQGAQVRNYLLLEGAVPMSCYDPDAPVRQGLVDKEAVSRTPQYDFNPVTNEADLGYRGYLQNIGGRLSNFFNGDDYALVSGVYLGTRANWEANEESYKPDGATAATHSLFWSYYYNANVPLETRAPLLSVRGIGPVRRYVRDSWEMKSFVSRPQTQAVGAMPVVAGHQGNFIDSIDLNQPPYSIGRTREDHSAVFTRSIQALGPLYVKIREALEK